MSAHEKKFDVGILGWWYGQNYGSILTYFGLNRAIKNLGYSVLMVHEPLGYNGHRVKWPDDIIALQFARRMGYDFTEQAHYSTLDSLNDKAQTFVVGSDQLWNPLIGRVNDDLFLDFVRPENRRVAYATSFGNKGVAKFKPEFVAKHSANLKRFSAISVRENYAVETAKSVFGVSATQVVDPVFLLETKEYEDLAATSSIDTSGDYLAVFFLDPSEEKKSIALAVAKKLGLDKIRVIPNPDKGRTKAQELFQEAPFKLTEADAPENFLRVYKDAKYVLTDSFHGTAFAVIFEKPFSSIYNTQRGADRFKSLLGALGFGDTRRLHATDNTAMIEANKNISMEIDFSAAQKYITQGRAASTSWLKAALVSALVPHKAERKPTKLQRKITRWKGRLGLSIPGHGDKIAAPRFFSNTEGWGISGGLGLTFLSVKAGGIVRGNYVWTDLPSEMIQGESYRLTLNWRPRTTGKVINLHLRNPATEKFQVIGEVRPKSKARFFRKDSIDFTAPAGGLSQLMLGAIHFSGARSGAIIRSIRLEPIAALPNKIDRKPDTLASISLNLSLKDNERFVRAHTAPVEINKRRRSQARLMFHAHAIEKGLSRVNFRPGFGKISVPALAKEMNHWIATNQDTNAKFFKIASAVMCTYFERHKALNFDVSEFRKLFGEASLKFIEAGSTQEGGVIGAREYREDIIEDMSGRSFLDVIYGRRSVRDFNAEKVDDTLIAKAVQIAMQAPSVCNRQAAKVHLFENQADIGEALNLQGGFSGYPLPPKLLLVTTDLTAFLFATERNQPFVDGGLFMMTLLLGLEQVGLGACSLNTAMGTEKETKIRKILGIPDNEVFISFIAVGHFDPKVLTPRSKRIPVEEVLHKHEG